jgi:hypothetical protein
VPARPSNRPRWGNGDSSGPSHPGQRPRYEKPLSSVKLLRLNGGDKLLVRYTMHEFILGPSFHLPKYFGILVFA